MAALFTVIGGKFHYNLVEILTQAVAPEEQQEEYSCELGSEDQQCVGGREMKGTPLRFEDVAYVNNPHVCGPPGH